MSSTRELCAARQIPIHGVGPSYYFIADVAEEPDESPWGSVPLTAHDVELIRSYVEYTIRRMYNHGETFDGFVAHWSGRAAPYAAISGHNTVTFVKLADGDWRYRRFSWRTGPFYWPQPRTGHGSAMTLPELLDHLVTHGDVIEAGDWTAWKAARPEVFAAQVSS